jgi:hypothetical protein
LFYSLLDKNTQVMEQQLLIVAQRMGTDSEAQVGALLDAGGLPRPEQRLPLMEMAFPALKRRPPDYVSKVLGTVNALIEADGRVDVFEYLLARVIKQHMWESQNPHSVRVAGSKTLHACHKEALQVMAVLAIHGHVDEREAKAAFRAGVLALGLDADTPMPHLESWVVVLDQALPRLDHLRSAEKEVLVRALTEVVLQDGHLAPTELELLRVTCDLIHVPLPLLTTAV